MPADWHLSLQKREAFMPADWHLSLQKRYNKTKPVFVLIPYIRDSLVSRRA